jgi:hypothetical protein
MKLVFVTDEFELRTPVQQLLDRFLIGYPDAGRFHRLEDARIVLVLPQANKELERRTQDFGLIVEPDLTRALADADAALAFGKSAKAVISNLPSRTECFVYGALAQGMVEAAKSNSVQLIAGTATRGAFHLPRIETPRRLQKALVVVQGQYPSAEMEALEALLPLSWKGMGTRVKGVTALGPNNFWPTLKQDFWPLLKSAISRSDTPQGDPVLDGRTQDLIGLDLLEKLAKEPRGWLIEHHDGLRWGIAVLNGAINDYNVALQTTSGGILSTQVYRPPAPAEHHYSRLAATLERFFRTGELPWPVEQSLFSMELLERFAHAQRSMALGGQRTAVI